MVIYAPSSDLLEQSVNSIYSLSTGDSSSKIAELNARYGLARIIGALQARGVDATRTVCVFSPDGGITRNKERWLAGFGYGCMLRWPSKSEAGRAFAFPELKPNACGILVAKLPGAPAVESIWEKLEAAKGTKLSIEGSKLKLNLGVSNHFIEICRIGISVIPGLSEGDIVAVMHTSPSELKDELYDYRRWVESGGSWDNTELGPILTLEGEVAEQYYQTYREIDDFSRRKRLHLARVIFGEFEVISNGIHQGMFDQNLAALGVYNVAGDGIGVDEIFPLTLRADLPIYLMRGRRNLTPDVIASNGLAGRALERGHHEILEQINFMPHGGGYKLLIDSDDIRVRENGSKLFFHFSGKNSDFVFSHPRELPYDYRGREVLEKILALKLGDIAAEAHQLYTLKY